MRALLVMIISLAIIGWIVYYAQEGSLTETVQVGSEGIKKAQEVKQSLEQSPQDEF